MLQAVLLFAGAIFALIFVDDPKKDDAVYVAEGSLNPFRAFIDVKDVMSSILMIFLSTVFLATFASTLYDNAFNYYINSELNLQSSYNGIIKAVTGITGLIANFTINVYIAERTNMRKSIVPVLLLCGIFASFVPFMPTVSMFFIGGAAFYLFNTIYMPIQQSIIMTDFNKGSSGFMSGILNSIRSVGMIFGSLIEGVLYTAGSSLPFIVASAIFIASSAISGIYYSKELKIEKAME